MTEYTVVGTFQSRDGWQTFETTVEGDNESVAEERAYAAFGSQHNLKRTQIEIEEVQG